MAKRKKRSTRKSIIPTPQRLLEGLAEAEELMMQKRWSEACDLLEGLDRRSRGQRGTGRARGGAARSGGGSIGCGEVRRSGGRPGACGEFVAPAIEAGEDDNSGEGLAAP